ncbi:MAG: glycosyltransferase family A protein [Paludibacter sp.]|nr:glycosyltransferase family A protein [Paludibacter sp.]
MTGEEFNDLSRENPNIGLVRPFWNFEQFHRDLWKDLDVTVLICQRKTKNITQLCLESLLRFYPDIPILVVDGNSQDDSTLYLDYKSIICPNVKVWHRTAELNSHGVTMNEAIHGYITTEYVLLMDSDVITMRYGYIEGMLQQMKEHRMSEKPMYATGTLMLVTRQNFACGAPDNISDVLRYAHPSCSLYHVPTYKSLNAPFTDHGAPCVYNMLAAESHGLIIGYWPVDKYVAHLSGASWCVPKTIWNHDNDVPLRPFLTFIVTNEKQVLELAGQEDHDFDIVPLGNLVSDSVVVHDAEALLVTNHLYDLRFRIHGEYVCHLNFTIDRVDKIIVTLMKKAVIEYKAPDELFVGGLRIVKRHVWQRKDCLL